MTHIYARLRRPVLGLLAMTLASTAVWGAAFVPGASSARAVNGGNAVRGTTNPVPWYVHIAAFTRGARTYNVCGGTVLTAEWVLTAAHCAQNVLDSAGRVRSDYWVTVEAESYSGAPRHTAQSRTVDRSVFAAGDVDLLLLHLSTPLSFNVYLAQLPVAAAGASLTAQAVTIAGQAATNELRAASTTVTGTGCYGAHRLCTAGLVASGGDSGGPVSAVIGGREVLVGVITMSAGDQNIAEDLTVASTQAWIHGVVGADPFRRRNTLVQTLPAGTVQRMSDAPPPSTGL